MIISLIVAMDRNRGIGVNNTLPWRLSADLKMFKQLTMGHHIIFGRKTYESIGKPLPGRTTIIITRNIQYNAEGCIVVQTIEQAIDVARNAGEEECFICGGAEIYNQSLDVADKLYLTEVHADVHADTFFPQIGEQEWQTISKQDFPSDEKNQYDFTFRTLEKVKV